MSVDISGFEALLTRLKNIDLVGEGPPTVPVDIEKAVRGAAARLPKIYRDGYVEPLLAEIDTIRQLDPITRETVTGAVYDHDEPAAQAQLHQFLAVISNLYRSFLSNRKRIAAGAPLTETEPPLAMFLHTAELGPFTLPVDQISQILDTTIGVVSMPSAYRDQPLLWPSLAHETGGHDCLHADRDLLPELAAGIRTVFGGAPVGGGGTVPVGTFLGMLWSYWIDEAASDVYGVLNIGPSFGLNQALFLSALGTAFGGAPLGALRTDSGPDRDGKLDVHPTDILRLDLVRGAIERLTSLSQQVRDDYVGAIDVLSARCGGTAATVHVRGRMTIADGSSLLVDTDVPMATMKAAARTAGAYIATARLAALGGHGVQEIETWDDPDEAAATAVHEALSAGRSAADLGDDAQLLAGATLAAFADPDSYESISRGLADALTVSWNTDPIWSQPTLEPVWQAAVEFDAEFFAGAVSVVSS